MFFLVGLILLIPLSLSIWIINIILNYHVPKPADKWQQIVPSRCIMALGIPNLLKRWGVFHGHLDQSGVIAGLLMCSVMTLSNYCFLASLFAFFVTTSKLFELRLHVNGRLRGSHRGGLQNWVQVLCSGGVATELAIIFMIEVGCRETLTDFSRSYTESWLAMAVLGAFACSSGDTYASELGGLFSSGDPRLITSLRKVPKGTNGGVSLAGLLASGVGGAVIGCAYYAGLVLSMPSHTLSAGPPQWPVILVGALAGFLGSLIDSIMGATIQYSGYHEKEDCIVEQPGPGVVHISGTPTLDNHSINLMASFITALLTPTLAFNVWHQFV